MLIRIHTQPLRPSEFTSPPSYRLTERTSPIVSHIAEILPDRVLYLHFWTINSLSYSVRRYLWNTGHGGSPSVVRTGGSRMTPNHAVWRLRNHRPYQFRKFLTRGLKMYEYASCDEWWCPWCQCPVACPGCHSSISAGVGCTGHIRPADRAQKVHNQDAILVPKDSGHNFPRRRSCPELPSSKRLRMFLLQWLPLRLGSIVANSWLDLVCQLRHLCKKYANSNFTMDYLCELVFRYLVLGGIKK